MTMGIILMQRQKAVGSQALPYDGDVSAEEASSVQDFDMAQFDMAQAQFVDRKQQIHLNEQTLIEIITQEIEIMDKKRGYTHFQYQLSKICFQSRYQQFGILYPMMWVIVVTSTP